MKKITYVGPQDVVETEYGDAVRGEPFEVPDEAAGRAPSGVRGELDEDGQPTYDPGEGYLAQPGNWQPWPLPKPKAKSAPAKKAPAKKAASKPAAKPAGDATISDEKGNG
jgi:hypothetical protein